MTPKTRDEPFFIGFSNTVPAPLVLFLAVVAAAFIGGMAGLALALSSSVDDPGDGFVAWGQYQELSGILETEPYPILRLPAQNGQGPRAYLLSGQGKNGVQSRATPLSGQPAEAGGVFIQRGSIQMLQVGGRVGLRAPEADPAAFQPEDRVPLGRWRLTGEICDGKCYLGIMRPGRGLSHKACANLCIAGGVPPVFVAAGPVDGQEFFVVAGPDGGPMPDEWMRHVAVFIEAEGEIERMDDLYVFRIDPSTIRPL
ncbi:MAG: hypothetical protein AAGD23_11160 [Pseudomonadota bacterium]